MKRDVHELALRTGDYLLYSILLFIGLGLILYSPKLLDGIQYFYDNPRFPLFSRKGFQPNAIPLIPSIIFTIVRLGGGVGIGVSGGVTIGIFVDSLGLVTKARFLKLLFLFAPVTPLIWYRVVAGFLGYGAWSGVTVISLSTMFVVAIATVSSLEEFPSSYRAILHCHPAPPMRRLFMVTLPFLLPSIVLFIRVCLVISWGTLIHVESSGMRTGIGRIFAETYNANAMPAAHLCTVVLIVIAISIDVVVSAGCRHFPSALKWVDG